jgi:flagellar biosynthesis protein FlhF
MGETLAQVKREFGRDAVILNTRTVARGGVFGLGGKDYVEISAAPGTSDLPAALRPAMLRMRSGRAASAEGAAETVSPRTPSSVQPGALLAEMGELKSLVTGLVEETRRWHQPDIPEELFGTYRRLVENEVAETMAQKLVAQVRGRLSGSSLGDPAAVRAELARLLESMLPTAGPIHTVRTGEPTMIALVGPTGVGKTTTLAKLAANFCLKEHRAVGLITIDTYRIAAVEQLKTYARIIDVPLEVAATPRQLKEVVAQMADREIILVDTAGRSQRDAVKIKELKELFSVVRPHEIHLVLAGTCGEAVLMDAVERFSELGIDRVIFTKLDEALGFGVILNCLHHAKTALSYVTTGQDVPDDIEVGEGRRLAELILGERDVRAAGRSVGG